jgi:hypothetical protein
MDMDEGEVTAFGALSEPMRVRGAGQRILAEREREVELGMKLSENNLEYVKF